MKVSLCALIICVFALCSITVAGENPYAGLKKCKMCHKGEKKGSIYEAWEASAHAQAYNVLGDSTAKAVYAKLGLEGNPQEDPSCLKCHVTGAGIDTSLTVKIVNEDGVSCESCHGAGGSYFKKTVMENHELSVANGMNPDPKAICISCHNSESPTFKEFNLEERWAEIKHQKPE